MMEAIRAQLWLENQYPARKLDRFRWKPLVLTVPAPVNPTAASTFDRAIEGAVSAMAEPGPGRRSGYLLERYWLPWRVSSEAPKAKGEDSKSDKASKTESETKSQGCGGIVPGVVLFRPATPEGGGRGEHQGYAMFLVGESPVAGIEREVLAWTLERLTPSMPDIVGPYYSGSARSLGEVLSAAQNTDRPFPRPRLISGTATSRKEYEHLCDRGYEVRSLAGFRDLRLEKLLDFVRAGDASESAPDAPEPVAAILHEDLTAFGHRVSAPVGWLDVPLPPSLGRVRQAYADEREEKEGKSDASDSLALRLNTSAERGDLLPELSNDSTIAHDLALDAVADVLRERSISNVAIHFMAQDDIAFVAQRLRRELPEARLLSTLFDRLYLHPDYATAFDGALVVTPYPQLGLLPRDPKGNAYSMPLTRDSSSGIYRAVQCLLVGSGSPGCSSPTMTIGVIRNGRLWPLWEEQPHEGKGESIPVPRAYWLLLIAFGVLAVVSGVDAWQAHRQGERSALSGILRWGPFVCAGIATMVMAGAMFLAWAADGLGLRSSRLVVERALHVWDRVSPWGPPLAALTLAGLLARIHSLCEPVLCLPAGCRGSECKWRAAVVIVVAFLYVLPAIFVCSIASNSRLTLEGLFLGWVLGLSLSLCQIVAAWCLVCLGVAVLASQWSIDSAKLARSLWWRWGSATISAFLLMIAIDSYPFHPLRVLETTGATMITLALLAGVAACWRYHRRYYALTGKTLSLDGVWGSPLWKALAVAFIPLYLALQAYFPLEMHAIRAWVSSIGDAQTTLLGR